MADYGYEFFKWDKDLNFLIECLVETLEDLGRGDLAAVVPWSSRRHEGRVLNRDAVRVYSLAFQILNTVEENTANQSRRRSEGEQGGRVERGRWREVLPVLKKRLGDKGVIDHLRSVHVCPTLTAHPTEAKRASVLEHYRSLYLAQVRLENQMYSASERSLIRDEIKATIERIFRTGEVFISRPDVFSELRNIEHFLADVFPSVITLMVKRFVLACRREGVREDELLAEPVFPGISFGNWVGGDRDGHPLVTSEVTRVTLQSLRSRALELQRGEVKRLAAALSIDGAKLTLGAEFQRRFEALRAICGTHADEAVARNPREPFRQYLNLVLVRLPSGSEDRAAHHYDRSREYVEDLKILARALKDIGADRLALEDVGPAIQIAHTFGFHLAKLDIRENSRVLEKALAQCVDASQAAPRRWTELSTEERAELIRREMKSARPFVASSLSVGAEGDEVRRLFQVLAREYREWGSDGLGSFIVSMTRSAEDLFTVALLAREGDFIQVQGGNRSMPLPVVPLFETIDDLQASQRIMDVFWSDSATNVAQGGAVHPQDVMIGYSDSNKDGGILASFVALEEAQARLLTLSKEKQRAVRFFHGRGGTISRGAGPMDRFLAALPDGSLSHGMKLTEQGETISQKYANLLTASYNLEVLYAGVARHALRAETARPAGRADEVLRRLATVSSGSYRELLASDGFVAFFRAVTPVDVIEESKIGSRPTRRGGGDSLEGLRAIPWVFAWNQSRFLLSGWFGVGAALGELRAEDRDGWNLLKGELSTSATLSYLLMNIETSLHSASGEIMQLYSTLCHPLELRSRFMGPILSEFERSRELVAELLGGAFSERRPRMFKTLSLREPPLKDLHSRQVELLTLWRSSKSAEELEELLLVTNAIAGGLRTTG